MVSRPMLTSVHIVAKLTYPFFLCDGVEKLATETHFIALENIGDNVSYQNEQGRRLEAKNLSLSVAIATPSFLPSP